MNRILLALLLALAPTAARAGPYDSLPTPDQDEHVPVFAIACLDAQGRALPPGSAACAAMQTQAVSGTVTSNQGAPNGGASAAWWVQWSGQSVAVSNFPATQAVQGVTNGVPIADTPGVTAAAGGVATTYLSPVSAASTNLTQIKAGAGRAYKIVGCNTTTTTVRIKFYDALSANVTVGATVPKFTRVLPPATAAGGVFCQPWDESDIGWSFSTGITFALTTGAGNSDATAPAAGAITDLNVDYQ